MTLDVFVTSALDATLDQVVVSLQGSGINASDLFSVSASEGGQFATPVPITGSGLLWSFRLAIPFAKLKVTVASLTTIQATLQKNGQTLTVQAEGGGVSSESLQATSCQLKDLVADAQEHAQKLAAAAGLVAGPILAISDGGLLEKSSVAMGPAFPGLGPGPGAAPLLVTQILTSPFALVPNCFAEVKFKLIRLH
ncbi:MAG TPA: hypothetical protein VEU96_13060 [Bryobacteraceae bacterium]|nr:hypothetical protein [Bryobacteraceae bacterium]